MTGKTYKKTETYTNKNKLIRTTNDIEIIIAQNLTNYDNLSSEDINSLQTEIVSAPYLAK
jgi:hypothetical protein